VASSAPRYARAFAEVSEAGKLDFQKAEQQLRDFADAISVSHELREFLESPSIEMPRKLKVVDALAPRIGMYPQVRNFVAVILEHRRLGELNQIIEEYHGISDTLSGITEARITSARALDPAARSELEDQITKLTGGPIRVSYAENANLLGGVVVEIGSTIYDGSLRTQLDQMKTKLVNA
jgi:F-type H+-transporting ATPase subunit delta